MARRAKLEVEVTGDGRGFQKTILDAQKTTMAFANNLKSAFVSAFSVQALTSFTRAIFKTTDEIRSLAAKYKITNAEAQQLLELSRRTHKPMSDLVGTAEELRDALTASADLPVLFSDEALSNLKQAQESLRASADLIKKEYGPALTQLLANVVRFTPVLVGDPLAPIRGMARGDVAKGLPLRPLGNEDPLKPLPTGDEETEAERKKREEIEKVNELREESAKRDKESAEALVKLAKMQSDLEFGRLSIAEKRARLEQEIYDAANVASQITKQSRVQAPGQDAVASLIAAKTVIVENEKKLDDIKDDKVKEEHFKALRNPDSLSRIGGFVGGSARDRTPTEILRQITGLRRDLISRGIKVAEL